VVCQHLFHIGCEFEGGCKEERFNGLELCSQLFDDLGHFLLESKPSGQLRSPLALCELLHHLHQQVGICRLLQLVADHYKQQRLRILLVGMGDLLDRYVPVLN